MHAKREEGGFTMVRTATLTLLVLSAVWAAFVTGFAEDPTAEEVLDRTRAAWQGESFHGFAELDVAEGTQTSSFRVEIWTEGEEKALLRILEPEDQAGSGYLMTEDELWYYSPEIGTAVQLPSIALGSSVFGAGPALDDLFRSTLSEDYDVSMTADPSGYALTLVPHPDTPVVYGQLEIEVRADYALEQIVYYDQRGNVLQTATFSDNVTLADRVLPTTIIIVEANGDTTVQRLIDPEFGVELDPSLFTVESLENPS
jgi:hypothetical protein